MPKKPVILEAGGHYGEDTVNLKSIFPNGIFHVFEPLPSSFKKLSNNTKKLAEIHIYECALSDHKGNVQLNVNPINDGASSIGAPIDVNKDQFGDNQITVKSITINDWAKENSINHVHFMWLDLEGHELTVLENSLQILDSVQAIYTEVNFVPMRENQFCLYHDLKKFLELKGFSEVWIEKFPATLGWKEKYGDDRPIQGNALFIRK